MKIISNNWDNYGKQDTDVMDSKDLTNSERKKLQKIAYLEHPKKNFDDYVKQLNRK